MAGKLNLAQPRPAAVPANQGGQLCILHDFSGESGWNGLKTNVEGKLFPKLLDIPSRISLFPKKSHHRTKKLILYLICRAVRDQSGSCGDGQVESRAESTTLSTVS
jgi:hypothetical protein